MKPDTIPLDVAVAAILLVAAAAALVLSALRSGGPRGARLARRKGEILASGGSEKDSEGRRKKAIAARLRDADKERKGGSSLRDELRSAGWSVGAGKWTGACLGAAILLGAGAWIAGSEPPSASAFGLVVGLGLPRLFLKAKAKRRKAKFIASFADAMDIIVRGLRSGLPLGVCVGVIGRELPDPIGGEFRLVSEGQRFGMSLREALDRAVERMPVPEMRFFAIAVAIQQQTGGNLAETLARLSDVLRGRKRMRDKVRAFSSEAKTSAMIIGGMPFGVMLLMAVSSPKYLDVLFSTSTGHTLLGIGGGMMCLGMLVIRHMIDFDI